MKNGTSPPDATFPDQIIAPFLSGAQHWLGLALSPVITASAVSLLTFAAIGLLLRSLPPAQAGTLALLLAVLEILSLVGLHGTPAVILRLYGSADPGAYDWTRDLLATMALAAPIMLAGIVLSLLVYDFVVWHAVYLLSAVLLMIGVNTIGFMFNSQRRYVLSNFMIRLPNAFLLIPALGASLIPTLRHLDYVLLLHGVGIGASFMLSLVVMRRFTGRGRRRISLRQRAEGLIFLGSSLAMTMSEQGLMAVAGLILSSERIAIFAGIAILLRPFRLLRSIFGSIVTPELIKRPRQRPFRLLLGMGVLALCAGIAAMVLAPPLTSWFYQGRYDEGLSLIPLLALAGTIQLAFIMPKAEIRGRAPSRILNRYVLTLFIAALGGVVAGALLIRGGGLAGLAISVLLVELLSALVSLTHWLAHRKSFHSIAVDV